MDCRPIWCRIIMDWRRGEPQIDSWVGSSTLQKLWHDQKNIYDHKRNHSHFLWISCKEKQCALTNGGVTMTWEYYEKLYFPVHPSKKNSVFEDSNSRAEAQAQGEESRYRKGESTRIRSSYVGLYLTVHVLSTIANS